MSREAPGSVIQVSGGYGEASPENRFEVVKSQGKGKTNSQGLWVSTPTEGEEGVGTNVRLQMEPELEEPQGDTEDLWAGGGEGPALVGVGWGGGVEGRVTVDQSQRGERERKRSEAMCLSNGTPRGDPQMKKAAWGQGC